MNTIHKLFAALIISIIGFSGTAMADAVLVTGWGSTPVAGSAAAIEAQMWAARNGIQTGPVVMEQPLRAPVVIGGGQSIQYLNGGTILSQGGLQQRPLCRDNYGQLVFCGGQQIVVGNNQGGPDCRLPNGQMVFAGSRENCDAMGWRMQGQMYRTPIVGGYQQQGYGQHANVITTALGVSGEVLDGCTNGAGMGLICGYTAGRMSGEDGGGWKGALIGFTVGLARSASEH